MLIPILLVYLTTALLIQVIFFFIEKFSRSAFEEIFKEYEEINPYTLINIVSFIPIYNIWFLLILLYVILHWVVLSILWVIKGGNKEK